MVVEELHKEGLHFRLELVAAPRLHQVPIQIQSAGAAVPVRIEKDVWIGVAFGEAERVVGEAALSVVT